jgi:hypothetical protein
VTRRVTYEQPRVTLKAAPRSSLSSPRLLGAAPTPIEDKNGLDASRAPKEETPARR